MEANRNKIIKAIAIILLASTVLCACQNRRGEEETTTAATTSPSTTAQTTETTTETTTEAPETTSRPTTAATTRPIATTTAAETTQPPTAAETTTLNALQATARIIGYYFLTPDQINETAGELADSSDVYYVRLQDGSNTFYIAVDLQTAQALSLANPQVLRALCKELEQKQKDMADGKEYVLMDYKHLVGELEIHYVGYLLTGVLGGESGPLASFYNSCKIADLNIDESRFGPIIDIIGAVYG